MNPIQQPLDPSIVALAQSISKTETGGSKNAYIQKGASQEYGAYQYTPATWAGDSQKYLGQSVPLTSATPAQQDEVAYKKIEALGKQGYKPAQIASIWNSGNPDPTGNVGVNKFGVSYDTPGYVNKVEQYYNQFNKQPVSPQNNSSGDQYTAPVTPDNPAGVSGTPSLANIGKNLAALPGQAVQAGNQLLPAIGDVYHDIKGDSQKTGLQQLGDVGTTALTIGSVVPGVDLADLGALGGKGIGAAMTRGGLLGAGYGASGSLGAGQTDPTQIALSTGEGAIGGATTAGILSKVLPMNTEQKLKSAINDATPSYNPKLIGSEERTASGAPRIQEGSGLLNGRTVNPTENEIAAGTEGSKIPNYPTSGTALQKYNAIAPAIAQKGKVLMESLQSENVLRPPQEVKSIVQNAVNEAAQNSVLLQKSDPAVTNYLRVVGRAIDQSPGTLAGEMQVRQILDNAYEDAGGKYGDNKALDQIHRAARNVLNNDMEAKATNTAVKASLREQMNLYNLQDILGDKAKAEGGTSLERAMKRHPLTTKVTKAGIGMTGLGSVLHLIP